MTSSALSLIKKHGVALTGGIATGKSTVARMLRDLGFVVFDADQISREVTAPGSIALGKIAKEFGPNCLNSDGSLNRQELRKIVFSSDEKRKKIEEITHPLIREAFQHKVLDLKLDENPRDFFYEAALIYEKEMEHQFREVWVTYCERENQKNRLLERDGLSHETSEAAIRSQINALDKAKKADCVIHTNCSLDELKLRVRDLVRTRNLKIG